jgi:phosphatidylserine/phosphatidylglycerophosphate/cardiolipin synthase-like enzyme
VPEAVEIFVPCDVVNVNVVVGPHDHLSPLEELFLRAVHEGASGFYELADLFGLGPRLTLDLVFDLWRRGYLVVDMTRGAVQCTEEVRETIRRDELEKLSGGETREETRDVMLDLLTGSVLPVRGSRGLPVPRAAVPVDLFDFGIETVSRSSLIEALRRVVERRNGSGRPVKVLAARLSARHLQVTAERRWLPVHVESRVDESGTLVTRVADADMPAAAKRLVAENLALIAEDRPDSSFVQYLLERADSHGEIRDEDLSQLLRSLESKVADIANVDRGLRESHELQLQELADEIESRADDAIAQRANLTVVAGQEAHAHSVRALIAAARQQLVLVCPWIRYRALSSILGNLEAALARGVQIFVLWGIAPDSTLDQDVSNALLELRLRHPTRFFFSTRSAVTHAKLLVQDDEQALVSSLNFLSSSRDDTFELGLLVGGVGRRTTCGAIRDLLAYARAAYPEYIPAQSMFHLWEDFHEDGVAENPRAVGSQSPAVSFSSDLHERSLDDLDEHGISLWQIWWRTRTQQLLQIAAASPDTAAIRKNGQHREALWRLIGESQRRLVVTSDQLGPEVVDQRLLALLEERLRAGVKVLVVYNRLSRLADGEAVDGLQQLASRFDTTMRVVSGTPSHSKLVVSDDVAVVTSFNFLSFEGYYEDGRRGRRRPQRSEIGVELRSGDATNSIMSVIAEAFAEAAELFEPTVAQQSRTDSLVASVETDGLVASLTALARVTNDEAALARAIRDLLLRAGTGSWSVLDWLARANAPRAILRVAAACALQECQPEQPDADRWRMWLAEDRWTHGAVVEAAILRACCTGVPSSVVPRSELTMLAAAWGTPAIPDALAAAVSADDLSPAEVRALAMISTVALLVYGLPDAAAFLELHTESVEDVWRPLTNAALEFWQSHFQSLPMSEIKADLREQEAEAVVDESWEALARSVSEAQSRTFAFGSGLRMRTYLFSDEGPMHELVRSLGRKDTSGVAAWLTRSGITDVQNFLDDATRTATGRDDQLLHSGTRVSYVRVLEEVRDAAAAVTRAAGAAHTHRGSYVRQGAISVAELLATGWPALSGSVDALSTPERDVVRLVFESLRPVVEWSSTVR